MSYSFKEKKAHLNALLSPQAGKYDLVLLHTLNPQDTRLQTYSRNPSRYAEEILFNLLDLTTRELIRENRRVLMAVEEKQEEQTGDEQVGADTGKNENPAHNQEENKQSQEGDIQPEQTSKEEENPAEEAEQALKEAENRAEEAEQALEEAENRAEEAEQALEEAETRAEEAEQALKEEKKKDSPAPKRSKSKKNIPT